MRITHLLISLWLVRIGLMDEGSPLSSELILSAPAIGQMMMFGHNLLGEPNARLYYWLLYFPEASLDPAGSELAKAPEERRRPRIH